MKISELIEKLQDIQGQYGDLPVVVNDSDYPETDVTGVRRLKAFGAWGSTHKRGENLVELSICD